MRQNMLVTAMLRTTASTKCATDNDISNRSVAHARASERLDKGPMMADFTGTRWLIAVGFVSLLVTATLNQSTSNHPLQVDTFIASRQFPGFTALNMSPPHTGLVVTSLQSQGPAERAGLEVGDDIIAINNSQVRSLAEANSVMRQATTSAVLLHLLHKGRPMDVSVARSEDQMHGA
jgi:membrane-associated protease RseP (regulator of RpoE activity)